MKKEKDPRYIVVTVGYSGHIVIPFDKANEFFDQCYLCDMEWSESERRRLPRDLRTLDSSEFHVVSERHLRTAMAQQSLQGEPVK